MGCVRAGKFIPTFAAQARGGNVLLENRAECQRIDGTRGVTARAERPKTTITQMIEQRLSHNAAG